MAKTSFDYLRQKLVWRDTKGAKRTAQATYDYSVDGGTIGSIPFRTAIPANAIITNVYYEVLTQLAGVLAVVGVTLESAGDLLALTTVIGTFTTGIKAGIQVGTAATMIKTTAVRVPQLVIGTTNLSAGKLRLYIEYVISQ